MGHRGRRSQRARPTFRNGALHTLGGIRRLAVRCALLGGAALVLSSCSFLPYGGASSKGRLVHSLYIKTAILALIILLGVIGTITVELIAFRRRRGDETEAAQDHGRPAVYAGFFVLGLALVAILFPTSESTLNKVDHVVKHPDLNVTITGSQWQWAATYQAQGFTVSGQTNKEPLDWELPVNKSVKIDLKSTDVMHGFYLPQFNFSKNAIPGVTNTFSFTPDRLGTYRGQCTQLCGVGHYQMALVLKVVSGPEFAKWVHDEQSEAHAANCAPPRSNVTLTARNVVWDTKCFSVPANKPFTITMKNQDAGIAHNFSIYSGPDAKKNLFKGPLITGPATKVLQVPALPAGTYYFQCDVHGQAMSGTLIVGGTEKETQPASGTAFKLTVKNVQWSATQITVPAGKPITVTFENEDPGITHNFAIYADASLSKSLFKGPLTKGPAVRVLHIPALPAGSYYFQCDVHGQAMSGTYQVTG